MAVTDVRALNGADGIGSSQTRGHALHKSDGDVGVGAKSIVLYLMITHIDVQSMKYGFYIGPIPLFLTDIFLIFWFLTAMVKHAGSVIVWILSGLSRGFTGVLIWILVIMCSVHLSLSFSTWGIMAVRDFAIFGYALIFIVTYTIMDAPEKVAFIMKWFVYSGVIAAGALVVDTLSGAHVLFDSEVRYNVDGTGETVSYGNGDLGGVFGYSIVSLVAFILIGTEKQKEHIAMLALCCLGLMTSQTRSAMLGCGMGLFFTILLSPGRKRLMLLAGLFVATVVAAAVPMLFPESSLGRIISGAFQAFANVGSQSGDANGQFRLLRWQFAFATWKQHMLFGVGYGAPLMPAWMAYEVSSSNFNGGLPHNSFLTLGARMGVAGLAVLGGAWLSAIYSAVRACSHPQYQLHALAAGAVLVFMVGYANFVLFLERPFHGASLWIVAAAACRLREFSSRKTVDQRIISGLPANSHVITGDKYAHIFDKARRFAQRRLHP